MQSAIERDVEAGHGDETNAVGLEGPAERLDEGGEIEANGVWREEGGSWVAEKE